MKFEAYNPKEAEKGRVVRLRLVQEGDGVSLVAVNQRGVRILGGNLLSFGNRSRPTRCPSIARELGLDLDEEGRLLFSFDS